MKHEFETSKQDVQFDVCGIGNAIVDVLALVEDDFITTHAMPRGGMQLVDTQQAETIYDAMSNCTECSGGSVANTMAGMASLGARVAFMGRVHDDELGKIFRHDMRSVGVAFDTPAVGEGKPTARCLICVTPDAERTMNTFIGACAEMTPQDIDEVRIKASGIVYVEGYLWDQPAAKAAIRHGIQTAKIANRKVALSLSDLFCVERHRGEFNEIIHQFVDVLFANEAEILALTQLEDVKEAALQVGKNVRILAVTLGGRGVLVVCDGEIIHVTADALDVVIDTTGAGDLFAAGFLYGLTQGWKLDACAELGNRCAGEIIQQIGARSQHSLKLLVA